MESNQMINSTDVNVDTTNANATDTTLQQTNVNVPPKKLTPEQEEELKLRAKYPNTQKPGGSAFIQKMLHKGHKKYFDSGDYNMAKSKNKLPPSLMPQTPTSVNAQNPNAASTPNAVSSSSTSSSPQAGGSLPATPSTPGSAKGNNQQSLMSNITNTSANLNTSANNVNINVTDCCQLTTSNNANTTTNNNNNSNSNSNSSLTNTTPMSVYSSPIITNPNTTGTASHYDPLSQSINTDNQSLYVINDDIIGHEIPTPECLPTRKHSVVQSKLATTTN